MALIQPGTEGCGVLKQGLHATRIGVTILALVSMTTGVLANETHTVGKGDTLWSIARNHRVSVDSIKRTNGVSSNKPLRIGTKLSIPTGDKPGEEQKKSVKETPLPKEMVSRFGVRTARRLMIETRAQADKGGSSTGLIRTALAYRGTPYVRGGTGARGFDCSGFTRYVYSRHGVALPHSSCAQASCGNAVDRSELRPGDLVFFQTRARRISHVGIYIGRNRFVHAATPRHGVTVSSLDEAYYRSRYRGARRVKSRA